MADFAASRAYTEGQFADVKEGDWFASGVKSAYDIDTNSYKYSGIAIFDCAPAIGEAIVKLVKATA